MRDQWCYGRDYEIGNKVSVCEVMALVSEANNSYIHSGQDSRRSVTVRAQQASSTKLNEDAMRRRALGVM